MPDRPSQRRGATAGSSAIDGGVRVAWGRPAAFDRDRALGLLGAAERARAGVTRDDRLDRFLLGRMLLRDLAADAGGVQAEQVAVEAACERCGLEHGRPRLRWPDAAGPAPSVGLASCDGLVVAALAPPEVAVGIDVERPRAATSRGAEVERRDAVSQLLGGPRRTAIRRWVRAEAVLKADGRGLRVEPAHVRIDGDRARLPDRTDEFRLVDRRIDGCLVSVAVASRPLLP
jgi:4'-phosphopantetheinyl transferase